jgi:hypothetical protein
MSDIVIQASFNSGEWSPALYARVDMQKYRSGAALLQNWFVDYRGGASTRAGTKYVIQAYKPTKPVRLIPFMVSFNIGYVLEFGDFYIRFIFQGSPVLENPFAITGATQTSPIVLTIPGNNYVTGDWIYVSGVGGMTQLNGRYFAVSHVAGNLVTINDLDGDHSDGTGYGAYTSGGTAGRIYTIGSPYAAADLALIKYAQTTTEMVLCHSKYVPYVLTIISPTTWSLTPITFGTSMGPVNLTSVQTSLPPLNPYTTPPQFGQTHYTYVVAAVDAQGQEGPMSNTQTVGPVVDMRTFPGSNFVNWNPIANAVYYKVYEAPPDFFGVAPPGIQYGYVGYSTGNQFVDANFAPDYSESPQVIRNPFVGSGISFVTVTAPGTYTSVPGVSFSGGSPSIPASATATLTVQGVPTITAGGTGFVAGDTVSFGLGIVMTVTAVSSGVITSWAVAGPGAITTGGTPANPISQVSSSSVGTGAQLSATWGVGQVTVLTQGAGYGSTPSVVFSAGAAAATATVSATGNGNPSVPWFFQQRLGLAAAPGAPATFHLSQPGSYFNFNITNPVRADNAITETLVSNSLNTIKGAVSVPAGLLLLTDQAVWIINGGYVSQGISAAVTPTTIIASEHSYVGANDMPPIIANYDILFVESKSSKVRDVQYNIYYNIFTGTDISITASHLFFGYNLTEWAWVEQPFYTVQAIRNDGQLLTLTYLKEQEFVGWSHSVTQGLFRSVATIEEPSLLVGNTDACYVVVDRVVDGSPVKYIERFAERVFPAGLADAWCVDSALGYAGAPATQFQGAEHLAGMTVTGLADGVIIPPFVMGEDGMFTLPQPASKVVVGLAYTCDLQTLPLAVGPGEAGVQGKVKKIPYVDIRVWQALGLSIGNDFGNLTPMKDLVQGNVSSMLTGQSIQVVNGLYTGDARTFLNPTYTVPGQYCIRQSLPYPATVLGVFPAVVVGDDS